MIGEQFCVFDVSAMSALGHSRRFRDVRSMSALAPIADMRADIDLSREG